ncbi:hypothetical protein K2Z84_05180 [Candidatus Binatia bacterium]|nr:hypothetical protein [Candidatus Binatia bacterium]
MTLEWHLSNVPFDATEEQIEAFVAQSGVLVGPVRMLHNPDGEFRGYCFVRIDVDGGAIEMEAARRSIYGQRIATPRKPKGLKINVEVARMRRQPPERRPEAA